MSTTSSTDEFFVEGVECIWEWLDTISFTKEITNIPRDFSDGRFVAELVNFFQLRDVPIEMHNFPPVNSIKKKMYNFEFLNKKVFKKMGFKIKANFARKLATSTPGAAETLLKMIYSKIQRMPKTRASSKRNCYRKMGFYENLTYFNRYIWEGFKPCYECSPERMEANDMGPLVCWDEFPYFKDDHYSEPCYQMKYNVDADWIKPKPQTFSSTCKSEKLPYDDNAKSKNSSKKSQKQDLDSRSVKSEPIIGSEESDAKSTRSDTKFETKSQPAPEAPCLQIGKEETFNFKSIK